MNKSKLTYAVKATVGYLILSLFFVLTGAEAITEGMIDSKKYGIIINMENSLAVGWALVTVGVILCAVFINETRKKMKEIEHGSVEAKNSNEG